MIPHLFYVITQLVFWLSFCLVLYAYVGYPLVLWIASRGKSVQSVNESLSDDALPRVSMVIPAYNEAYVMAEKLANCAQLDYPQDKIEFLIGSDGSTDGTNDIVSSSVGMRLLAFSKREGKGSVLNKTVSEARADVIVFSDANTMYRSDAVRELVRHFENPQVGCVSGRLVLVNRTMDAGARGEGVYWRYETMLKRLESRVHSLIGANGAIYAIRRHLYKPVPFGLINDDFFISMKVLEQRYRVIYTPTAIGVEETAPNLEGEFVRHVRDATGHYQAMRYALRLLHPTYGLVAFEYFSHRIIRWSVPLLLLIMLVANGVLGGTTPYQYLLLVHLLVYGFSGLAWLLRRLDISIGPLYVPLYFFALNLALAVGFYRYLRGNITWERVRP